MKRLAFAVVAPFLFVGIAGAAQASSLTLTLGPAPGSSTSLETFDSGFPVAPANTANQGNVATTNTGWGTLALSGAQIVQNSLSSEYAAPFNPPGSPAGSQETSPYLSVYSGGTATFTLTHATSYFGLQWGSVDTYNSLSFYDHSGNLIGTVQGADVIGLGGLNAGDWGVSGTAYADISSTDPIWKVIASSSGNSFEFDNVRVAAAPLPAALPMFGAVLAGLGAFGWRRRSRRNTEV